jgi:diguanylate cyclase (GGDEF)-like protein
MDCLKGVLSLTGGTMAMKSYFFLGDKAVKLITIMNHAQSILEAVPRTTSPLNINVKWRSRLMGMGRFGAIVFVTGFSIAMSLLMVLIIAASFGLWGMRLQIPMIIATVVPAVIAPIVGYFLMTLLCELDESQQHLRELAHRDSLTKAFNRHFFMDQLTLAFHRAQRIEKPISLLMIDVDRFKSINDTYGHASGDEVLKTIAKTCEKNLRPHDIFARYGGEEFVVLLSDTTGEIALTIAERMRESIAQLSITVDQDTHLSATLCIGVATNEHPNLNEVKTLLSRADSAMYDAKKSGRNRCVVAD